VILRGTEHTLLLRGTDGTTPPGGALRRDALRLAAAERTRDGWADRLAAAARCVVGVPAYYGRCARCVAGVLRCAAGVLRCAVGVPSGGEAEWRAEAVKPSAPRGRTPRVPDTQRSCGDRGARREVGRGGQWRAVWMERTRTCVWVLAGQGTVGCGRQLICVALGTRGTWHTGGVRRCRTDATSRERHRAARSNRNVWRRREWVGRLRLARAFITHEPGDIRTARESRRLCVWRCACGCAFACAANCHSMHRLLVPLVSGCR